VKEEGGAAKRIIPRGPDRGGWHENRHTRGEDRDTSREHRHPTHPDTPNSMLPPRGPLGSAGAQKTLLGVRETSKKSTPLRTFFRPSRVRKAACKRALLG